jgi:Asp-tRNA(Asn)/Glu-tRNA(Gln) amidotransferase A subunit family amidase
VEAARASMTALRARLDGVLGRQGFSAFVCPGATGPAPLGLSSTGNPVMSLPWTHAGLPSACLPAGFRGGLPLGMQVIGRFGGDEDLLALCGLMEKDLTAGECIKKGCS